MSGGDSPSTPLAELLRTFGVSAVVAVDDGDRDQTFDSELLAVRIEQSEETLTDLLALDGVQQLLNERGVERDDEATIRELIADGLRNGEISLGLPESPNGTSSAFSILESLLGEAGISFGVVHFQDWGGPGAVDATTLVLFDFRHGTEPEGVPLAVSFIATHGDEARVAILSQEPGEAHELWAEHVAGVDASIARQLVWIPKASLTAEPSAIVEKLAVALSAPLLRRVREDGVDLLRAALDETATAAAQLDPYELHQLTVGAASDGGFEPESVIGLFARRSLPVAISRMQLQAPVHAAIRQLRQVNESEVIPRSHTTRLIQLQRDDYYVSRLHLVGRHQAAIAGDIFAKIPAEVVAGVLSSVFKPGADPLAEIVAELEHLDLCVLVGQPCDLAVRPSGRRAMQGRWLEALPVTAPGGDSDGTRIGPAVHQKQHIFRLPWLANPGDSGHRRVAYKNVLSLPTLAVDACVWSTADAAALMVGAPPSPHLSMNWQQRHAVMTDEVSRIAATCALVSDMDLDSEEVARRIKLDTAASDDAIGFHFSAEPPSMAWGLVRVARLRSPYVESLLTSYNDFRRRDAFPTALG